MSSQVYAPLAYNFMLTCFQKCTNLVTNFFDLFSILAWFALYLHLIWFECYPNLLLNYPQFASTLISTCTLSNSEFAPRIIFTCFQIWAHLVSNSANWLFKKMHPDLLLNELWMDTNTKHKRPRVRNLVQLCPLMPLQWPILPRIQSGQNAGKTSH